MIKNMIWMLLRVLIAYLLIGPTYAILILSNTATPVFLDTKVEVLAWISCFLLVIGYVLIRFSKTRYMGKLLSLSVLGAVVLIMYVDERYRIFGVSVNAWSLFLVWTFVGPISLTYELISNKTTISIANYQKVIDLLPELYLDGFQSGLFSMLLVLWLYAFIILCHNPKRSYQQLASHVVKIRNTWH